MSLGSIRITLSLLAGGLIAGLIAPSASSQSNAANQPPGVSVLDCKWEKRHYAGTFNPLLPAPTVGQSTEANAIEINRPPERSGSVSYGYSVRVKNDGPRVIRSLALDYVFTDPDSKVELARRSLRSFEKVELNQKKWLEVRGISSGPPKIATVEGIKKDLRSPFDEHVEIKCVLYTDGTGWKAPDAETKTCDELVRLTLHPDARRN